MGGVNCCISEEVRAQNRVNAEIERQLKLDYRERSRIVKFLFLEERGSGRRTLMKQLRFIYGDGYSEAERMEFVYAIHRTIYTSIHALVQAMQDLNIKYTTPALRESANDLLKSSACSTNTISPEHFELIQSLWADPGVQECFERRGLFEIPTSAKYYLDNLQRICAMDYIPTNRDIWMIPTPKPTIEEYYFKTGSCTCNAVLLPERRGHSRLDRLIWQFCLESVHCVIFVVDISAYDQFLFEDKTTNSLAENCELLRIFIGNRRWFRCSHVAIVFNKMDLFKEKMLHSDLVEHFPEYTGPKQNSTEACRFISEMFLNAVPDTHTHHCKCFYASDVDTTQTSQMFQELFQWYFSSLLREYHLV